MSNKKRTYKKNVPRVQEVTFELDEELNKIVSEEEQPKKKFKTVRIGHPDKGWIWQDIEE